MACGGTSLEEFAEERARARECAPADTCIVATFDSACLCPAAVNAAAAAALQSLAADVDCEGMMADCAALEAPRCELGQCVAD